jgi:hypothetical protein
MDEIKVWYQIQQFAFKSGWNISLVYESDLGAKDWYAQVTHNIYPSITGYGDTSLEALVNLQQQIYLDDCTDIDDTTAESVAWSSIQDIVETTNIEANPLWGIEINYYVNGIHNQNIWYAGIHRSFYDDDDSILGSGSTSLEAMETLLESINKELHLHG